MSKKRKSVYGDLILFSIGRAANDWTSKLNDGLIYANDSSTLGDGESTRFALMFKKDDAGAITGEKLLLIGGRELVIASGQEDYELFVVQQLQNLMPWEVGVVKGFVFESECGASFSLDSEQGKISVGDGGEIRIDDNEKHRAGGSLVVNATIYRDCNGTVDSSALYGVEWGDCEPNDPEELCALIWSPSTELIETAVAEAEEYRKDFSNSLNLYISIVERWKSIIPERLESVWQLILAELPRDVYIWNHARVARLAKDVLGDVQLYREVLERAKGMGASGVVDYVTMAICVAEELSSDIEANRAEIVSLMNEAVERASSTSEDDICKIIETTASEYAGCRLGDLEFAKSAIDRVLARVGDAKIKAKIKKKAESALKNYI